MYSLWARRCSFHVAISVVTRLRSPLNKNMDSGSATIRARRALIMRGIGAPTRYAPYAITTVRTKNNNSRASPYSRMSFHGRVGFSVGCVVSSFTYARLAVQPGARSTGLVRALFVAQVSSAINRRFTPCRRRLRCLLTPTRCVIHSRNVYSPPRWGAGRQRRQAEERRDPSLRKSGRLWRSADLRTRRS